MNMIRCSNCSFENTAGLRFCTNCGSQLPEASGNLNPPPTFVGDRPTGQSFGNITPVASKSNTTRNLAIFGGLGCLALLVVGVPVIGLLVYLSGGTKSTNNELANLNVSSGNRNVGNANAKTSDNSVVASNTKTSSGGDSDDNDLTDIESDAFTLPPNVGPYEQTSSLVGNPADDFPSADKAVKAVYNKKGKDVEIVLAQFGSAASAKTGYEEFLKGFKTSGAKVLGKQKVKNKAGMNKGEVSIFTFKKKWEAMLYTEKYGFRISAPDRYALIEFAQEFDKLFNTK